MELFGDVLLDSNISLTKEEYCDLIEMCKEHKIYIVSTNKKDINNEYK